MDNMEKKMAAAMAAVGAYMQMEQEACAQAAAMEPPRQPGIELNHWGQSGRQGMMNMRTLMQLRAFNRLP